LLPLKLIAEDLPPECFRQGSSDAKPEQQLWLKKKETKKTPHL